MGLKVRNVKTLKLCKRHADAELRNFRSTAQNRGQLAKFSSHALLKPDRHVWAPVTDRFI
jgi:hypothetical protein